MKNKKIIVIAFMLMVAMAFTGCMDSVSNILNGEGSGSSSGTMSDTSEKTISLNKKYKTSWFDFTIKSADFVDEYQGYTPAPGNLLLDVVITETGTFESPSPMGTMDFYADATSFEEYIFPMDPFHDDMMPYDFMLAKGETVEYHMVYEVPDGESKYLICYTEINDKDEVGRSYTLELTK